MSVIDQVITSEHDHPGLHQAEDRARLALAQAIARADEVEQRVAAGEPVHSLLERAAVEAAKDAYADALAALVRAGTDA